jgi:hypothetical protein
MTLTKGDVPGEKEQKNNIANDELLSTIAKLQNDLKELKESGKVQQGPMNIDDIIKLAQALKGDNKTLDYESGIQQEEIPMDDFDPLGTTFCAPSAGYVITDDRRNGHIVKLPYNKNNIFFEYQGTRKQHQGKYQITASFCAYTSHSKKETEWLRKHSMYNILFYENSNAAASMDINKAQKLSRVMNSLRDFELPSLVKRAKEYNIPVSDDIYSMRVNIALKMVEKEIEDERSITAGRVETTLKEHKLFQGQQ